MRGVFSKRAFFSSSSSHLAGRRAALPAGDLRAPLPPPRRFPFEPHQIPKPSAAAVSWPLRSIHGMPQDALEPLPTDLAIGLLPEGEEHGEAEAREEEEEEEDGPMTEFLSRFVWMMREKLADAFPGCGKETLDGMLLLVAQKVVAEMDKGGGVPPSLGRPDESIDLSPDLWRTVWEVSKVAFEETRQIRRREEMRGFLHCDDVKEMCRFAGEIGIRGDMLRELRFKWAQDKLEESEFYRDLERIREEHHRLEELAKRDDTAAAAAAVAVDDSVGEGERVAEVSGKPTLAALPQRRGKIKFRIHGLDLSDERWVQVSDKIHEAEKVIAPEEPQPVMGECNLVTEEILNLKEDDDPSPLLAKWVDLLRPKKVDWLALLDRVHQGNPAIYFKIIMAGVDPRVEEGQVAEEDPGWTHCQMVGGLRRRVKCNWCHKEMSGGVTRLKQHLSWIQGEVKRCEKCPKEVKQFFHKLLTRKGVQKQIRTYQDEELLEELAGRVRRDTALPVRQPGFSVREPSGASGSGAGSIPVDDSDSDSDSDSDADDDLRAVRHESRRTLEEDEQRRRGAGPSGTAGAGTSSFGRSTSRLFRRSSRRAFEVPEPPQGLMDPFIYRKQSAAQKTMKQALRGVKKSAEATGHAVSSIVKFFVHQDIAANAATSPYFQVMLDSVGEHGPGLKAPTPKYIYEGGLDNKVADLQHYIDTFKYVWRERGCTIMCDGWTGTTRKSMINFLVYCTEGTIFLQSVDASNQTKNANYLFKLMDDVVEKIGEDVVVQVVIDNEPSYKSAGRKLQEKRKHLFWVPCAAHSLDLMMEDMGKDKFVNELVAKAQQITSFIYGHNRILNMMRLNATNGRDLIRSGPTRFASNFIALESLLKFRHELIGFFNSREFMDYCTKSLTGESFLTSQRIAGFVGDKYFWNKMSYYLKLVEPIVQFLRMVDGDDKNDMGYLYEAIDVAKEKIKEKYPTAYQKWWDIIDRRWEMTLHHPLHAAGYFLNPRYQYSDNVHNDSEVRACTLDVIRRLTRNVDERIEAEREMEPYRLRLGTYGEGEMQDAIMRLSPAEWWISVNNRDRGRNALAYIAIRVLSQTIAAIQCERNWSTFSLIHSRIRNRLKAKRLEKLVFCHYNIRLRLRNIAIRQALQRKRALQAHDEAYAAEDPTGHIDVDELFEEEHPLNAWVETRNGLDTPVFDPEDTDWSEGILDGAEARDPELRSSKRGRVDVPLPSTLEVPFEPHRHSDSLPGTPRMSGIEPSFRRSLSHIQGPSRRGSPEAAQPQAPKTYQRGTPRGKGLAERVQEHQHREQRERRGKGKEVGSKTSGSQRSRSRRKLVVGSDDETQPPSHDDGAAGVGYGTTAGGGSGTPSFSFYTDTQGGSGQGQGEHAGGGRYGDQPGYGGQQQVAGEPGVGWPHYDYYDRLYPYKAFQPDQPNLSPLSIDTGSSYGSTEYVVSETSSIQHDQPALPLPTFTPRGIKRGYHEMAASLFGYGYGQYMQSSSEQGQGQGQSQTDDDESTPYQYPTHFY